MSLVTNLQDFATRVATESKALRTLINGNAADLTGLNTTAKTNLVAAINEISSAVANASGIDDTGTSTTTAWSSSKTASEISAAAAAIVDTAPGTLDTLNELAAALGDDPNFATTITTALGNRLRFDAAQTLTAPQQAQGLSNLGAAAASHTHTAADISDSSAVGRSVLTATDATAARTAIGAGTSNLVIGTTSTTAKAGDYAPPVSSETISGTVELATAAETTTGTDTTRAVHPAGLKVELDKKSNTGHTHTAANISDSTATGRSVLTATDAAAARTAIGAGTSNLVIGTTSTTAKAGDYAPAAATDLAAGIVELATAAEVTTGTDTVRAVTPAGLKVELDKKAPTSHTHTAANISDSTATGRSVLTATDAAAARTAIGAGTSNLVIGTTSTTAKAGDYAPAAATDLAAGIVELATSAEATTGTDTVRAVTPAGLKAVADTKAAASHTHTAANISDSTTVGRAVLTATDAAAGRAAIGAGTSNLVIGTTAGTAADAAAVGDTTVNFVTTFEAALV